MQILAAALAALAGFVDASGFMATGGFFVSFMSGNSTRMGIGAVEATTDVAIAAGLIFCFLIGVVCGAIVGRAAGAHRRTTVLILVALLLAASATLGTHGSVPASAALMAFAMGTENNVFERKGQVSIGVTYMTGSLVKLGQGIAASLLGGNTLGWIPYLILWLGFVAGVITGAGCYPHLGLSGVDFHRDLTRGGGIFPLRFDPCSNLPLAACGGGSWSDRHGVVECDPALGAEG